MIIISVEGKYIVSDKLEKDILSAMPYAEKVALKIVQDSLIVKEAQDGLKAIGLNYHYNKDESLNSFVISGALNDAELQRLQSYVSGFYNKWGSKLVKFNIELSDNKVEGSVSFGELPYIKKRQYTLDILIYG